MPQMTSAIPPLRRHVTIEWGDCDPAGIVYYPRYFAMFDTSTAHLFEAALGCKKRDMLLRFDIVGFPMVDTRATFLAPSRFGDIVTIESRLTAFHRSSFEVSHKMFAADGRLAVEAFEKRVWAAVHPDDPNRIKGRAIPQEVVGAFSADTMIQRKGNGE
jgi:4-hydroxybenzoyl-CoA thioesterase